jgi:small subunit ribosomal protein S1
VPGAVLTGRVSSIREFGAFVDLGGGVEGLVHVSEMGWARVKDASAVVAPGDEVTVKVLSVDPKTQKISLGLKQLSDDPWSSIATRYVVGQTHQGRVTRLTKFGAFIELEAGIEGLAHVSESGVAKDADLARAFPAGAVVEVVVLEIDASTRRIRLSRKAVFDAAEAAEVREYTEQQKAAAPTEGLGSLADKLRGALGTRKD